MKGAYFMDYELMMNGNVKIGQRAPEFEANTTMGKISLNDYTRKMASIIFSSSETLHLSVQPR